MPQHCREEDYADAFVYLWCMISVHIACFLIMQMFWSWPGMIRTFALSGKVTALFGKYGLRSNKFDPVVAGAVYEATGLSRWSTLINICAGPWTDYKGWISGGAHFLSSLVPQVFPMAEAAQPYTVTFRQEESASPQYGDPEKSSVTEGKVYDSG